MDHCPSSRHLRHNRPPLNQPLKLPASINYTFCYWWPFGHPEEHPNPKSNNFALNLFRSWSCAAAVTSAAGSCCSLVSKTPAIIGYQFFFITGFAQSVLKTGNVCGQRITALAACWSGWTAYQTPVATQRLSLVLLLWLSFPSLHALNLVIEVAGGRQLARWGQWIDQWHRLDRWGPFEGRSFCCWNLLCLCIRLMSIYKSSELKAQLSFNEKNACYYEKAKWERNTQKKNECKFLGLGLLGHAVINCVVRRHGCL